VALPLLIGLIHFSNQTFFNLLVLLVAMIGLFEFYAMALPKELELERVVAILCGFISGAVVCWQRIDLLLLVLVISFGTLSVLFLLRMREINSAVHNLVYAFFGIIYVPLLLSHVALLREFEHGREWLYFSLVIAMVGDSAAYFVGSAIGRTKLSPLISPNKTVEGALGGLAGSVVGAWLVKMLFLPQASYSLVLFMAFFLAIFGQLGDLFESMLKRCFAVKDSGSIIPGHGGVLDRLDSLLFVFPVAYYCVLYFG